MEVGGWAMLIASWSAISAGVAFCLWRVWRGPSASDSKGRSR